MLNSIFYNISEGVKSLWRNRGMTLASIASVAASLFVLGIVLSVVLNINNFAITAQSQFDSIQIFLIDDIDTGEIASFKRKIENIDGVKDVVFESKEMAMEKFKERWGEEAHLLEGIDNPLQNSFIIEVVSINRADAVVNSIRGDSFIDNISYYKDVIDKMITISRVISTAGLSIILLLSTISLFIIANTIKIALYARKREINIMKYIGATNWFIRWPFVIEGLFLGLIGSLIAAGAVFSLYSFVYSRLANETYSLIGGYLLPIDTIFDSVFIIFVAMGIGIGILGSLVSLRRYLKV
ncbi:cell division transport system permease protein [Acetoanaerobium pronyense]|uniref:Cell division protein FtsX n=1 Tax=Acetoanaerobium pronyense TaxID=1482736 RepID=A0ABS4KJI9_9FIRM|nr:permease-like cell division protein FtsX [Acetoanaerobium pronyense]MBP2027963.1 cell division transport system permease protein [Acetoanaerobium pronyense]